MNAAACQHADAGHRARVLRALGVTPWQRRTTPAAIAAAAPESVASAALDAVAGTRCVVVLPQGCSARELDLLGRALSACGAALARAARVTVSGGQLAAGVPEARAYLVLGEAQAHALGRALPAAVMHQAQIVLADEPALLLASAGAKRRLWNALRSVRRALAAASG
ncbi:MULTISPECIES: hypothetical protein [Rhodanobacter]|uniref:hypothetical protein n=1 Tax=Rhodanobacter TaxID=75309 RepID=UPI00030FF536|nr:MULTISPECIES: hypothetical protein [Rhodanobacter]KZC19540.1 hypothetical protein RHOFW104R3_30650 [Rhodanobacter denitrificans]UJJ51891.1 hypothetical protein LRK52_04150 [Rhodanobacter denitrificans]UJM89796.1 hypothetical protein LRK24_15365 [Rhodanobacter denitrificans]UJM94635.1 hypothetical protein LRK32_04145 [Rhodanobacter denitrificans]UJM98165.1 hypothetical protein LRK44_04150 [Rhodanobacter denitrificans]